MKHKQGVIKFLACVVTVCLIISLVAPVFAIDYDSGSNDDYIRVWRGDGDYKLRSSYPFVNCVNTVSQEMFYKPDSNVRDIVLKEVARQYGLQSVDSSRFGAVGKWGVSSTLVDLEPYKVNGLQDRQCEILGYDALLANEDYNFDVYTAPVLSWDYIPSNVAIMNIYKALGKYQYKINSRVTKENEISVFVTRSNLDMYQERMIKDGWSEFYQNETPMTINKFMVQLSIMMRRFGEPNMSQKEMYKLLQVYGGEIPEYLSMEEKDAYIYLKSRGITTDLINSYTGNINLYQMLQLLMKVKDTNSRDTFKNITITATPEDLMEEGYFPTKAQILAKSSNVDIEVSYDYKSMSHYDYLIYKDNKTTFYKDGDPSQPISDIGCYSTINTAEMNGSLIRVIPGSLYHGQVTMGGLEYYHISIPKTYSGPVYLRPNTQSSISQTSSGNKFILFNASIGGGILSLDKAKDNGDVLELSEEVTGNKDEVDKPVRPFTDDIDLSLCDKGREGRNITVSTIYPNTKQKVINYLYYTFKPDEVYAGKDVTDVKSNKKVKVSIKSLGKMSITFIKSKVEEVLSKVKGKGKSKDTKDNTVVVTEGTGDSFTVEAEVSSDTAAEELVNAVEQAVAEVEDLSNAYQIFANTRSSYLISYNDLCDSGAIIGAKKEDGTYKKPKLYKSKYELSSEYGDIKVYPSKKLLIIGNMVYKIPEKQTLVRTIKGDLYFDVRTLFGTAADCFDFKINTKMTEQGKGESTIITIGKKDDGKSANVAKDGDIIDLGGYGKATLSKTKIGVAPWQSASTIRASVLRAGKHNYLKMSQYYPGASYFIYNDIDSKTGLPRSCLVNYHIKENAYDHRLNGNIDEAYIKLLDKVVESNRRALVDYIGYDITNPQYYCDVYPLNHRENFDWPNKTGRVFWSNKVGYMYALPDDNTLLSNWNLYNTPYSYDAITDKNGDNGILGTYNQVNRMCLPLAFKDNLVYDYNFNRYTYDKKLEGSEHERISFIDIKNPDIIGAGSGKGKIKAENVDWDNTILAPVGVVSYVGRQLDKEDTGTEISESFKNVSQAGLEFKRVFYLGHDVFLVERPKDDDNNVIFKGINSSDNLSFGGAILKVPIKSKIFVIGSWTSRDDLKKHLSFSYIKDDAWLLTKNSLNGMEFGDLNALLDAFDFKDWSFRALIEKIDFILTWIIVFTYTVVPYFCLSLVTLLVGFSFMSQVKFVKMFAEKVFDPVYYLTFGRLKMEELIFERYWLYLIIAWIGFALCIDGNIVRVINWFLDVYVNLISKFNAG